MSEVQPPTGAIGIGATGSPGKKIPSPDRKPLYFRLSRSPVFPEMSPPRVSAAFAAANKRAALVAFVTAGFPRRDSAPQMLRALANNGADIIEVGVPFSDPMADGPAIQRANARALAQGMNLQLALAQIADFRKDNAAVPVLAMGYANTFLRFGRERFAQVASDSGASGAIIVDLADPDFAQWQTTLAEKQMDLVSLVAPTTPPERLALLAKRATGFVYFISLRGVTGSGKLNIDEVAEKTRAIRKLGGPPVAVGFGVKTPEHARALAPHADAVVVGSRFVEVAEDAEKNGRDPADAVGQCAAEIAEALKK